MRDDSSETITAPREHRIDPAHAEGESSAIVDEIAKFVRSLVVYLDELVSKFPKSCDVLA